MLHWLARRPLLGYLLIAYGFTWTVALPNLIASRGGSDAGALHWLEPVAAFGPFIAAMLVARATDGRAGPATILRSLGHWRVGLGPAVLAVLSPVVLLALALAGIGLAGGSLVDAPNGRLAALLTPMGLADLLLAGALLQAWGEEPGWRGFLLPRLLGERGPLAASLWLFPAWLLWHLPFFLSRPEFGLVQWLAFSVGILSASIWLTLIWQATRSVLMALLWHAMVNVCRGLALALSTPAFLGISNAVLLGAICIAGYWVWRERRPRPVEHGST